jgi:hypothetical protein
VGQSLSRLTETWAELSPVRKGLLTASGVALVALAVMVYSWSGRTEFVTLYTNLDGADSGRMVEQLRAQGVPYELDASGVHRARAGERAPTNCAWTSPRRDCRRAGRWASRCSRATRSRPLTSCSG